MAIRIAFPLIGRGNWTGGFNYLKNTLRVVRSHCADQLEALLFLSPEENDRFGAELAPLVDQRVVVNPVIMMSGRGSSLARALVTGRDEPLERLLLSAGADVAVEVASFYGRRFALPVISWIADCQHCIMPEMFDRTNWWRRDLGFRMQIGGGRTIMVSSDTTRQDLERFYPAARGRSHVVRFAIDLDVTPYLARSDEMRAIYNLPERFFFLPNQFWRHKNHGVVVEALAILAQKGRLSDLPPVVLTGQPNDPRNPTHFDDLMRAATNAGVEGHFRYLGLVPYDHVLALNAACDAMINPSRFEGWSTPIEEAKAFATPLMLSDMPIHHEQAPDAQFFNWRSAEAVAGALVDRARCPKVSRQPAAILAAAQAKRLDNHAASLIKTVIAAAERHKLAAA
ncbi:MAG: glycosyltransferase family 4 protein [Pseudorhodoplanes sp.]